MTNRNTRSSLLALLSSGLLVFGATGCLDEEEPAAEEQGNEAEEASADGFTGLLSGEVVYLAPGEYIVNDQAFYVSEDTTILGGVYACATEGGADADGAGTVACDPDAFESTLQEGTVVLAEVEATNGVAETITEYQEDAHLESGGSDGSEGGGEDGGEDGGGSGDGNEDGLPGGFTGTLSGEVVYLAPGEYIVNDQAFYVSEDTTILGGVYACATEGGADADGAGTVACDPDAFESTLQEGTVVLAEVVVSGGIAESITEYEH